MDWDYIAGAVMVIMWIVFTVYAYVTGHSAWPLLLIYAGVTALLTVTCGGKKEDNDDDRN